MKKLYLYSDDDSPSSMNKKQYLMAAAGRLGMDEVKEYKPGDGPVEYLLNIEPYNYHFFHGTKWTGVWEIDCLINRERKEANWDKCDTIFMANTTNAYPIIGKRVLLLQACDPTLYGDVWNIEKTHDFVLCGTISDMFYYKDFGEEKCEVSNDIYAERARVYGRLSQMYSYQYIDKGKTTKEYLKAQATGRIQFIRSMRVLGEGEIAQRFFELLPIGPVVTNYAPDVKHLGLVEGEDFLMYHNDAEMYEKMELLRDDEQLRNKIASNGREKAFQYHTYENRLLYILNYLERNHDFSNNTN
jgi:hypothetical protein